MALVPRFDIRVVDTTGKPIKDARVTVRRDARADAIPLEFEPQKRVYSFDQLGQGRWLIRAEAGPSRRELEPQEREATVTERGLRETFVLGRPGLPFYYRGKARVPFDVPEMIAVVMNSGAEREIPILTVRANQAGLSQERLPDRLARQPILVFRADSGPVAAAKFEQEAAAETYIRHAGRVVRLDEHGVSFLTDQCLVKLRPGVSVVEAARERQLEVVRELRSSRNGFLLRSRGRSSTDLLQICNQWTEEPEVIWAEPNLFTTAVEHETAPTPAAVRQGHHNLIDSQGAWSTLQSAAGRSSLPDILIAVADDGCDENHPDLNNNKIRNHFNFDNPGGPLLAREHGTKACGVAAGRQNTAEGVAGVAYMCSLIVARRKMIGEVVGELDDEYANMFEWCSGLAGDFYGPGVPAMLSPGADVISNSWGRPELVPSSHVGDVLSRAATEGRHNLGCVFVFAAGNDNATDLDEELLYPLLEHDAVICVSASTICPPGGAETKTSESNYGSCIDVCAPGGEAGASVLAPTVLSASATGYAPFGKTSCACAQVAGVAALVLLAKPHLTAEDVRITLQQTAVDIDKCNPNAPYIGGRSKFYGFGRVDAGAAVK